MKNKIYFFGAFLFFSQNILAQHFNNPVPINSTGNSGTGANIDVVHYRCDWNIDPSISKNITGTVTVYFKTAAVNVLVLTFDLNKTSFNNGSLSATYHGISCTKSFPSSGNVDILTVNLPATIPVSGTLDSISIFYSGIPPAVSGQAEGFQRKQDGLGNWYIYTLSESYEDKDWWPCKADMQDKADSIDINVTVPNTYWVAANGKLVDSAINGANRTFKYKHRYPIASYLVALGVAKYNRQYRGTVNISGTNVPVIYYTFPDMAGATLTTALSRMDVSKTELIEFSNKFGPYPFADEKHGYYQFGWGGGMEHQTFSAMSGGSMASWSVIAHELGHQWWGDKVSFATWNHLWLAEGFAKYAEVLAAELIPSIGVNPASHLSGVKSTARATNTTPVLLNSASISNSNTIWTANNDNAVYQRGCMVVSMLRTMMGDAKFFQGCRDYLSDPLLAYKSATTADLQRNMENQLSGINLTPFFNAWINGTGRTDYTGNYFISGKLIQFRLTQTTSPLGNPFMPMPVVIKIANAAGTYDTSVVIYHYSPTQLGYAGDAYGISPAGDDFVTYNLSFVPATITIDPDNKTMASGSLISTGTPLNTNNITIAATKAVNGNHVNLLINNNEPIEKIVLLKSSNGANFTEYGLMNKVNATAQVSTYGFIDMFPYPETYYRAKIYSAGTVQYSSIVKVLGSVNRLMTISPNPAKNMVAVSFANGGRSKATVRIISAEGKVMIESSTNNSFIHYDISNLSPGVYMVQVIMNGLVTETGKLMINR